MVRPGTPPDLGSLRIAIVHDWLVTYGGAERVLEQLVSLLPQAELFALCDFVPPDKRAFIQNKQVTTSVIQKLPFARKRYRDYLGLMPYAIEQFDLSGFDLVISSSHAVAHGVLTNSDQLHLSYVNNTMVYVWDLYHHYLKGAGLNRGLKGLIARPIMHYVRMWDAGTSHRVDKYIANSEHMKRRLHKLYGRESEVIYPPVDVARFGLGSEKKDYYVVVSRLVPFKRIDLVVEAFSQMPDRRLIVLGDGPELKRLQSMAGSNIEFAGFRSTDEVHRYVRQARAFMFSSVEPFGIAVVEALAAGTPVIAYAGGAALEIVDDGRTGLFFEKQTPEAIVDAVNRFESTERFFDPHRLRESAERFSIEQFRNGFLKCVTKSVTEFWSGDREIPARSMNIARKPEKPDSSSPRRWDSSEPIRLDPED
jgi:glycosyltransferase involved in cell wall biosynthesis